MTYDGPNDVLGDQSSEGNENLWWVDGREKKGRPPLKGIISLSPCKDGTILASIYNRWLFTATDTLGLYTSGYSIDLKAGRINIDPWVKLGGQAYQVQKLAIPCWPLFESLKAKLSA